MFRISAIFFLCLILFACSSETKVARELETKIQDGDIIFQSTQSRQCEAVKLATHSEYSHVGIIFKDKNEWMVYEAVQPVKKTPLRDWITHGENNHYALKRLKNAERVLTSSIVDEMQEIGEENLGKNYDIYFSWTDNEIYCSELVWKIYDDAAGIHIGELRQLRDFDLMSESVQTIMAERYGSNIPFDEEVIAPSDLFESDKLILIDQH
ncbi:MAG: YiiX family permuted papain-like enzyme [Crocinitomicaceae bacterium]|nr:YiiX family permuted papain-like enzyme [Crocinitomicaceae bacterium]